MPTKRKAAPPKKVGEHKGGRLSDRDKGFIREKMHTMSAEAIAHKIGRNLSLVQKEIAKLTGTEFEQTMSLADQLQSRPEWRQFQQQFTPAELDEFRHQYVQMVSTQFKDDLLPTEELQLFQVITLKILIDRTLIEQRLALQDMQAASAALENLKAGGEASPKDEIIANEVRYENAKRSNKECAERYKIYSDKQDRLFKDLKSTRDQRVKILENSKGSMLGWIRLLMEEESRKQWGDESELMKIAANKERGRLSAPITYEDGTIDRPFLSAETVAEDDD